jgi:transmembrane sensor
MNREATTSPRRRQARAEAGAWLARLRSEHHTPAEESGFQLWLAEHAANRQAFEAVTAVFEAAGAVATTADLYPPRSAHSSRRGVLVAGGLTAVAGVVALSVWRADRGVLRAEVGQPKRMALTDGSQLVLDTGSEVRVTLTRERRLVSLLSGRARFDVAKDVGRPFIVRAGGRDIIATGTAFTVSQIDSDTSVFLEEGRVVVRPADVTGVQDGSVEHVLAPGDRLVFAHAVAPRLDHPDLDQATAWQTGRAVFEDEPLATAVAEINRYSRKPIEIADPGAAGMRISGVYRTSDPEAFAQSVTLLLPVDLGHDGGRLILRSRAGPSAG